VALTKTIQVVHYPTLRTVFQVEEVLKEAQLPLTRYQIWKKLNKRVMKQTINVIVEYLEKRGLIIDGEKGIIWTYQPKKIIEKRIAEGLEVRVKGKSKKGKCGLFLRAKAKRNTLN